MNNLARVTEDKIISEKSHRTQSSDQSRAGRCLCVKVNQRLASLLRKTHEVQRGELRSC